MKNIPAILFLLCNVALADGKLTVQYGLINSYVNPFYIANQVVNRNPNFLLDIKERLSDRFYYLSQSQYQPGNSLGTTHMLMYKACDLLDIGIGPAYQRGMINNYPSVDQFSVNVTGVINLW